MILVFFWLHLTIIVAIVEANPVIEGVNSGNVIATNTKQGREYSVLYKSHFPFAAYLEIYENGLTSCFYFCGGVVITPTAILTAAHCVVSQEVKKLPKVYVTTGIIHLGLEKGLGHKTIAKAIKIHENYVSQSANPYEPLSDFLLNDIAIVWLKDAITFDIRTQPADLATKPKTIAKNNEGVIIGWGYTECGKPSPILKSGRMKAISNKQCQQYYNVRISKDVFCVISDSNKTTISVGDSGGPFILDGQVLGLASFALPLRICRKDGSYVSSCDPTKPAVFTNISNYNDWITKNLKQGPPLL